MCPVAIKSRDSGYTLLELLVVLAIIALVMTIVPNVYTRIFPNFETRQFVNDFVNTARSLRERAKREGIIVYLEVDTAEHTIKSSQVSFTIPGSVTLEYKGVKEFSDNGEQRIYFYPNGISSGGTVTIKRGAIEIDVEFSWITGAVKVVD